MKEYDVRRIIQEEIKKHLEVSFIFVIDSEKKHKQIVQILFKDELISSDYLLIKEVLKNI